MLDACLLNILVGCHACLLQKNLAEAAVPPVDGDCYILRAYILIIIVVNEEQSLMHVFGGFLFRLAGGVVVRRDIAQQYVYITAQ